jgi:hypothetical protein
MPIGETIGDIATALLAGIADPTYGSRRLQQQQKQTYEEMLRQQEQQQREAFRQQLWDREDQQAARKREDAMLAFEMRGLPMPGQGPPAAQPNYQPDTSQAHPLVSGPSGYTPQYAGPDDPAKRAKIQELERARDEVMTRQDLNDAQRNLWLADAGRRAHAIDPEGRYSRGSVQNSMTPYEKNAAANTGWVRHPDTGQVIGREILGKNGMEFHKLDQSKTEKPLTYADAFKLLQTKDANGNPVHPGDQEIRDVMANAQEAHNPEDALSPEAAVARQQRLARQAAQGQPVLDRHAQALRQREDEARQRQEEKRLDLWKHFSSLRFKRPTGQKDVYGKPIEESYSLTDDEIEARVERALGKPVRTAADRHAFPQGSGGLGGGLLRSDFGQGGTVEKSRDFLSIPQLQKLTGIEDAVSAVGGQAVPSAAAMPAPPQPLWRRGPSGP